MQPIANNNYAIEIYPDGSVVPCSPLDNVLVFKGNEIECNFHSFLTRNKVTEENKYSFYKKVQ